MINVEITKSGTDNTMQVIRKFSRRVQSSGLIPFIRKRRYWERNPSQAKKKNSALYRIDKAAERLQLIKEGKISDAPERRGTRRPTLNFGTPAAAPVAAPESGIAPQSEPAAQ